MKIRKAADIQLEKLDMTEVAKSRRKFITKNVTLRPA